MRVARATQRPGQSKEQTRLIAQGIQKGIDQYKKQQKAKARDLDRKLKKVSSAVPEQPPSTMELNGDDSRPPVQSWLPWLLLLLSWIGFALYLYSHRS